MKTMYTSGATKRLAGGTAEAAVLDFLREITSGMFTETLDEQKADIRPELKSPGKVTLIKITIEEVGDLFPADDATEGQANG